MLRKTVVVLVLGAILLAACGGDDGGATGETSADGGAPAAETGAAGGETGGTDGGEIGTIDAARCAELAQAMAAAAVAAVPQAAGGEDLSASVEQLEAFAAAAPEEIRSDMQTVVEGYAAIVRALEEAGYDPTSGQPPTAEQLAALAGASEQIDDPEFQAAAERVDTYFEAGCQG